MLKVGERFINQLSREMVKYRAKYNMSQEDFAELCNLSKQTVGAIENGRQNVTQLTLEKIMRILRDEFKKEEDGGQEENA